MVFYPIPQQSGLDMLSSLGDGYTINVKWYKGMPTNPRNKVAYNIYYSTIKETVYSEGIKYVSIDDSDNANIIDLTPGQLYYFSVRPMEYNPTQYNLNALLPLAYDNLRVYPFSLLSANISATDTTIPLMDTGFFPPSGLIQVGAELINYSGADYPNNNLFVPSETSSTSYLTPLPDGYYSRSLGNDGYLSGLTLLDTSAIAETWKIQCIFVQNDINNVPMPETAKFVSIGSLSGMKMDGYSNPYIWVADGYSVSNEIFEFSILENTTFSLGQYFTIIIGSSAAVSSGRGYSNTTARPHNVSGSDGYVTWDPIITYYIPGESHIFDRIFMCQCRFEYANFQRTEADGYHQVITDLLTSDLSASDEYNEDFPMYDYAGYHRTDPVLLLTGACVGSYIGGEMGCIDKYGNVNMLRGLSVQDANNQRQEMLLSTTGRPAVLVKRVRTGITCSCYQPSSEYQDDRCPFCFVPGTLINTESGFTKIEDIKVGDMVLSGDGSYKKVLNTFENDYSGNLNSIITTTTLSPILCTPNHQIFKLTSNHSNKYGCGPNSNCTNIIQRELRKRGSVHKLPSGKWQARITAKNHNRVSLGTFNSKSEAQNNIRMYLQKHELPSHLISLDKASNIDNKDWLINIHNRYIDDISSIEIPKHLAYKNNKKTAAFEVNEEFCWIVGLYLAEGCTGKRSLNFALDKSEVYYQNKVISFFLKYGYNGKIYQVSENGVKVEIYGADISRWFHYLFGKKCYNKKIPQCLMNLSDSKSNSLINGIFDGDSSIRDNELVQTSEILALQVTEILHRLGYLPTLRTIINKTKTPNGNDRKIAYCVNRGLTTDIKKNRKGRWQFNENNLSKVKSNDIVPYEGKIYNLEVEGEHSYVVQNILVKNCHGTKFVFGFDQYFNPRRSDGRIMVRAGPAEEDVKMYEAGLESEFTLDFWTLTVPTIKDRDVIILFDQEDNEEFRYEVLSVTRNNTLTGLQGGQKFRAQRIRKFDPAYQIRVFRNTSEFPSKLNTSIGFTTGILPHTHEIVINEGIISVNQINQTTSISQGHNHVVKNGVVMNAVGHTHTIIMA